MKLFDTHFHLEPEDDLAGMVERARLADVRWMLLAGASVEHISETLARLERYPTVYAAAGVHPHEAEVFKGELGPYEELLQQEQVKAVGEIGLDYHYDFADRRRQRRVLESFLGLAAAWQLPAVIHSREADEDCHAMLRDCLPEGHPFVVHCFTGTTQWAQRYLDIGGHLSFTGILTFGKADNVRESLRLVPLDRLMFETDSPYLAPKPHRGKRNEPAFVRHVVEGAARILEMDAEELAERTTETALHFFDVDPEQS